MSYKIESCPVVVRPTQDFSAAQYNAQISKADTLIHATAVAVGDDILVLVDLAANTPNLFTGGCPDIAAVEEAVRAHVKAIHGARRGLCRYAVEITK